MPWKETDPLKERVRFVLAWERMWNETEGRPNLAALCRAFGISRQTGHKWITRYRDAGHDLRAVDERPRRPRNSPTRVSPQMEDLLIRARKKHPSWGPRKLRSWLKKRFERLELPAASTIGAVLKRNGLTRPRRLRRRTPPHTEPFSDCAAPNAVWCVDFKGHFRTADGTTVYPLTIMDAFSRYLLRCEALCRPGGMEVWDVFEGAFKEYGLPDAIRSDNGSPFASTGAGGLSELSVWWVKLGIRPERIDPGHPEQNGRQERMHRTLKQQTAMPPETCLEAQRRAFDRFRKEYNEERPHEALGQDTPGSVYMASSKRLPKKTPRIEPEFWMDAHRLDSSGRFQWGRSKVLVNSALRGELVELIPIGTYHWEVRYGPVILGILNGRRPSQGLRASKKGRK